MSSVPDGTEEPDDDAEVPVVVPAPANGGQGNQVVIGIGGGNAEIAYDGNPGTGSQVFLESVNYQALAAAQASPPPSSTAAADTIVTSQSSGTSSSASLTIPAGTVGESDRATIAGGTFTILTKGPRKLTVHLTRAGKRLLARDHGHLGALVHLSEKMPGGLETVLRTVAISTVKHRHRK